VRRASGIMVSMEGVSFAGHIGGRRWVNGMTHQAREM
jgi:hypothetical protein